jgi:hypothetical protein
METASLSQIKKELENLPPDAVAGICLRLARYKKENKELLSYLLFEAADELAFVAQAKEAIDNEFAGMNRSSLYLAKKTVRKVLRTTEKFIRFSGQKTTELELLIYFCTKLKDSGLSIRRIKVLKNLYERIYIRIDKTWKGLHEDLQFDYKGEVEKIRKDFS